MQHFMSMHPHPLAEGGKTLVEYVWIGACSQLCSRTRVLDELPHGLEEVPVISVDGSSCGLTPEGGEIFLKPRKLFNDPFRGGGHLLCLCDTFQVEQAGAFNSAQVPVLQPHGTNNRVPCEDLMACCRSSEATFTAEQEFAVLPPAAPASPIHHHHAEPSLHMGSDLSAASLPFPVAPFSPERAHESEPPQKQARANAQDLPAAHIGIAPGRSGRSIAEKHLHSCLRAGIKLTEVAQRSAPPYPPVPGTHPVWSYQVGPLPGLELADQVWMSRFLLLRVSEDEGALVSFDPLQSGGLGRGLRCSMQYSTAATRRAGSGLNIIQQHIDLLKAAHLQHTLAYGQGSGPVQLAACRFSVGIGGAKGAIVVPSTTLLQQGGHIIDCRPCSNADPYLITVLLAATTQKLPLLPAPHRHVLQHAAKHHSSYLSPSHGAVRSQSSQQSHCCDEGFDQDVDDDVVSINSEDVLIDELDRMDGTVPQHYGALACMLVEEGYDECCSDGSSPEVRQSWL